MVTTTTVYSFQKPDVSGDEDAWGGYLNANIDKYESILTGNTTITSLVITTADINGGTLDNVVIGGSTPAAITGTAITGTSFVSSGNMTFGDSNKAIFGAGSDLSIFHDGSNSKISDSGTGNLHILADNEVYIANAGNSEYKARFITDGAVELYYDAAKKFETSSSGISVTGTITADGLTVDGTAVEVASINSTQNGAQINFDSASTSADWSVGISNSADGDFLIYQSGSGSGDINLYTGGAKRQEINRNGDISFYEDTGTTAKLFWDASAEALALGTATSVSNNRLVIDQASGDGQNSGFYMQRNGGAGTSFKIDIDSSDVVNLRRSATTALAIDSSGNIGVGTSTVSINSAYDRTIHIHSTLGSLIKLTDATSGTTDTDGTELLNYGNDTYLINRDVGNIIFNVTSSERMRIDTSGLVGIGVTSPSSYNAAANNLVISDGGNAGITIVSPSTDSGSLFFADGTSGTAAYAGFVQYGHAAEKLILGTGGTTKVTIDGSGNVGVGTSAPASLLHLDQGSGGNGLRFERDSYDTMDIELSENGLRIRNETDGRTDVLIDGSGNIGVGTSSPDEALVVVGDLKVDTGSNAGVIHFGDVSDQTKIVGFDSTGTIANTLLFTTGTSERMRIDSSGNVGIGTTSPNTALEVKQTSGTATIRVHADHTSSPRSAIEFLRGTTDTFGGDGYTDWKIGQVGAGSQADFAIISNDTTRGSNERFTIEYDTGNMGVGTSTPSQLLHVSGGQAVCEAVHLPRLTSVAALIEILQQPGILRSHGLGEHC